MKRSLSFFAIALILSTMCMSTLAAGAEAQTKKVYTDATTLNVFNKLLKTEKDWQRLDVDRYPGIEPREISLAKNSTGLAVCFETDSRTIGVRVNFDRADIPNGCSSVINTRGFDLYIQHNGKWTWAADTSTKAVNGQEDDYNILEYAAPGMKKCILYLPHYSQIASLSVITDEGSTIAPADPGFKGRICVFGSSYTNAAGCSRPGLAYAAQMTRHTGYNFINMGFSGRSKLQQYFASALIDGENVDAYVFDGFSNPSPEQIEERLFPFIERFQNEKPGVPLIFMKTIWRQKRVFNTKIEAYEAAKMAMADKMMKEAVKKYKDVYWLDCTDASKGNQELTTDGTHPNDEGYYLWATSVEKKIVKILKKYSK